MGCDQFSPGVLELPANHNPECNLHRDVQLHGSLPDRQKAVTLQFLCVPAARVGDDHSVPVSDAAAGPGNQHAGAAR
ncbi:hypothetical protein D3C74_375450 [compost metagenome]